MSFCYDMLQDIKRTVKEDFSAEYRNYLLLQQKIQQDIENGRHKFKERSQGAEMSLFIENVFAVEAVSVHSQYKGDNADELVKRLFERKQLIETVEKENFNLAKDFMANIFGFIADENGDSGVATNFGTNKRNSTDPSDSSALQKIFSKLPKALKAKDKFKQGLHSQSIDVSNAPPDEFILRAVSNNNNGLGTLSLKQALMSKFASNRTKTLNSEEMSDNSSDLDFCEKNRHYNKLEKRKWSTSIDLRYLPKKKISKYQKMPEILENENYDNISLQTLENRFSPIPSLKNSLLPLRMSPILDEKPSKGIRLRNNSQIHSMMANLPKPNNRYSNSKNQSMVTEEAELRMKMLFKKTYALQKGESISKASFIDSMKLRMPPLNIIPLSNRHPS